MDVLICEDDPVARSVISDLVEDRGGRVLAAVDSSLDAIHFLRQFRPDVVVVDLMLHLGSGAELVEYVRRSLPTTKVIIFTAYDSIASRDDPGVEVVVKPDFDRLGRIISSVGERSEARDGERRRPVRAVSAQPTTVDAAGFYRVVAEAHPDDVLLRVGFDDPSSGDQVADELRGFLRGHDFVLQRSDSIVALLLGGGEDTVHAVEKRFCNQLPHLADRATSAVAGGDPIDAFTRLTSG
ncbi:response regulator [Acidimicrobiia bacterium EGI L10123]|uniref:response regulator n=1 Tax=Salinilacustrithrix flava TaxID=2957203 RepID=UPI003D7C30A9|nr:response regulator [Acidimicrobiia bacterium EGI L10123]